jgi:hypothetical protein
MPDNLFPCDCALFWFSNKAVYIHLLPLITGALDAALALFNLVRASWLIEV